MAESYSYARCKVERRPLLRVAWASGLPWAGGTGIGRRPTLHEEAPAAPHHFTRWRVLSLYTVNSFPGPDNSNVSSYESGESCVYVSLARHPAGMFSISTVVKTSASAAT